MIWNRILLTLSLVAIGAVVEARDVSLRVRSPIRLPNPPGYVTLKCDLHLHTVFSDGLVWPTVRVEEAWREGLDAIALADHIEYLPFKADVSTNHNRSYEIAQAAGVDLDILVIRCAEITRGMPPGHFNCLFLTNANALVVPKWFDALLAAQKQGAFIMWNHPGWEAQLIDNKVQWFPEHTRILEAGLMHGIEIVNERDYYAEAHKWAIDKKLPILGNTDGHNAMSMYYDFPGGAHRPMTLVFARERTVESIKEALFEKRTAVFYEGKILGDKKFLTPIFDGSIRVLNPVLRKDRTFIHVQNDSDVSYTLELEKGPEGIRVPEKIVLSAQRTALIDVSGLQKIPEETDQLDISWRVTNLLTAPGTPLKVTMAVRVAEAASGRNLESALSSR